MSFEGYRAPELARAASCRCARRACRTARWRAGVLLTLAGLFGLQAGCICVVSDRAPWPGPAELDIDKNMDACIGGRDRRDARAGEGRRERSRSGPSARSCPTANARACACAARAGGSRRSRPTSSRAPGDVRLRRCDARAGARRPAGERRRRRRLRRRGSGRARDARPASTCARGTTSLLATLVTAPLEHLERALARLRARRRARRARSSASTSRGRSSPRASAARTAPRTSATRHRRVSRGCSRPPGRRCAWSRSRPSAPARSTRSRSFAAAGRGGRRRPLARDARRAARRDRARALVRDARRATRATGRAGRSIREARLPRAASPNVVGAFLVERAPRGSLILDGHHLHPELARALVELRGAGRRSRWSPTRRPPPGSRRAVTRWAASTRRSGRGLRDDGRGAGRAASSRCSTAVRVRGAAGRAPARHRGRAWPPRPRPRVLGLAGREGQPRAGCGRGPAGPRTRARARGRLPGRGFKWRAAAGRSESVTQEDRMRKFIRSTFAALALAAAVGLVPGARTRGRLRGFARRLCVSRRFSTRWCMRPLSFATMVVGRRPAWSRSSPLWLPVVNKDTPEFAYMMVVPPAKFAFVRPLGQCVGGLGRATEPAPCVRTATRRGSETRTSGRPGWTPDLPLCCLEGESRIESDRPRGVRER